jgi:hypothetical protein
MVASEGEMVAGIEPAVVGVAEAVEFANVDHRAILSLAAARPVSVPAARLLGSR